MSFFLENRGLYIDFFFRHFLLFCAISVLDFSFNLLRNIPDRLEYLNSLQTVYFIQNKISKITGLTSCLSLRSLELGGNKIRVSIKNQGLKPLNRLKIPLENRKPG